MTNTNEAAATKSRIAQVAETIIEQLGGRRIFAMAFASATYGWDAEAAVLMLKIAPALVRMVPGRVTHVTVRLEADDTYTVWLTRCTRRETKRTASLELVHADQLRAVVESMTGLQMTLGTMGAVRS